MAGETLEKVAPDVQKHPILWGPILSGQATYKEVMLDDVYDLVDLVRMNAGKQYLDAIGAYNQFVIKSEQSNNQPQK